MKKFKDYIFANVFILLGVACTVCSCDDPYEDSKYVNDDNLPPLALTMAADSAASEWVKVLKYANMFDALNYALNDFTVLLPTNEALDSFYTAKGVSSIEELGVSFAKDLVMTHTIKDSLKIDDIIKKVELVNLANEKLPIGFVLGEAGVFSLYNEAMTSRAEVLDYEIKAYNGYIYRINAVINPLNESVQDLVEKGGLSGDANRYTILNRALKETGWADSLSVIQDTVWTTSGSFYVNRRYYTLLAVADETFQKDNISSFETLVSVLGAETDFTSRDNELNKYVAYHILKAHSNLQNLCAPLNNLEEVIDDDSNIQFYYPADSVKLMDTNVEGQILQMTRLGGRLPGEGVSFVFNASAEKASFITERSDVLAKNGYLHEVDAYLPIWEPDQTLVVWDFADYISVKSKVEEAGGTYKPAVPVSSESKVSLGTVDDVYTFEVGGNGYANTSYYPITYVTCKKNLQDAYNYDRVVFNMGYMGWVQMKTPTLVRGKYRVELDFIYTFDHSFMRTMSDGNGGLLKMTIDDGHEIMTSPYTTVPKNTVGVYSTVLYEEIDFENTASHLFKFVIMDSAASSNGKFSLQFDCIRFIPITE